MNSVRGKRLHHFVPRSYLRAFGDADGLLFAILREPYETRTVHVNTVAAERDFYKIRRSDGTICDDLEDALSEFDGEIPKIVSKAASEEVLGDRELFGLRRLYANLAARGQLGRDALVAEVTAAKDRVEREFERDFPFDSANRNRDLLDSVIRAVFEHPEKYAVDPETVSRLALIRLAVDLEANMPRHVCVLESPRLEFIASDAPFSWFDPERDPSIEGIDGPRFRAGGIELTMPITRRYAVLFSNLSTPARAVVNDYTAAVVNSRTAFFARRMILAHHSEEAAAITMISAADYRSLYLEPLLSAFENALENEH